MSLYHQKLDCRAKKGEKIAPLSNTFYFFLAYPSSCSDFDGGKKLMERKTKREVFAQLFFLSKCVSASIKVFIEWKCIKLPEQLMIFFESWCLVNNLNKRRVEKKGVFLCVCVGRKILNFYSFWHVWKHKGKNFWKKELNDVFKLVNQNHLHTPLAFYIENYLWVARAKVL